MYHPSKQYAALLQISSLLDAYKLRNIDVIGNADSNSNFTKYYHFLKADLTHNEDLAAQHIGYKDKDDENYRRFRVDYRSRLLSTVFFIDTTNPNLKEYTQAYFRCSQQATILDIIMKFGYHDTLAVYGKEVLEQAQKFEIKEIELKIATQLRNIYAQKLKDKKEYEKYRDICKKLEIERAAERKAAEYFDHLMSFYTKSIDIQPEVYDIADSYYGDLLHHLTPSSSVSLIASTYTIGMVKFLSRFDYKNVIVVADKAIAAIKAKPYNADNYLIVFLNNKMLSHGNRHEFDLAREASLQVLAIANEGQSSWFNSLERTIRLAFHQENFVEALELLKTAKKHKNFYTLTQSVHEDWTLIEAYIALFEKLNLLPKGSASFKKSKFLNDTPILQADKSGKNINVQIIVLLHQILDNDNEDISDRVELLTRYRSRYLKGDHHARSYLFIQILKSVIESSNDVALAKKLIDDFYKKLLKEKFNFDNELHLAEIVPFNVVWVKFRKDIAIAA